MTTRNAFAGIGLFLFMLVPSADARLWTDATGKHQFEAALLNVSNDKETLVFVRAGKEYEIPTAALSKKDQSYVRRITKSDSKPKLTIKDVPEGDLDRMREEAKKLWPGDRQMQIHEMTFAVKDYLREKLRTDEEILKGGEPQTLIKKLVASAELSWPEDTVMQADQVQSQLRAYQTLKTFKSTEIPSLAVIQVKHNAKKVYPDDYIAQLRYVHEQIQQGKRYLAKLGADEQSQLLASTKRKTKKQFSYTPKQAPEEANQPPATTIATNTIIYVVQSPYREAVVDSKEGRLLQFLRSRGERRYHRRNLFELMRRN